MNGDGPYTLPEVHRMTGISLRSIERGCRNGTIEHLPIGEGQERRHRRMTRHQVDLLVASRSSGATAAAAAQPSPVDDLAEAIAASRRLQSRRTGRRTYA